LPSLRSSGVLPPTSPPISKRFVVLPVMGKPVNLSLLPPSSKLDWYRARPLYSSGWLTLMVAGKLSPVTWSVMTTSLANSLGMPVL